MDGVIIFSAETRAQQEATVAMLSGQQGVTVVARGASIRMRMKIPGYLAGCSPVRFAAFLAKQNPNLPSNSIRLVSILPGTNPVAFIDIDQRGQDYLETTGYTLNALGVELRLQEVTDGGKK